MARFDTSKKAQVFRHALSFIVAVLALGCAPAAERPASSGEIDLTDPTSERPVVPLGMCTEEPGGCGASTEKGSQPAGPSIDQTVWFVPIGPTDPVRGPADALVTLVVFSDFECPFCKRMAAVLDEIVRAHPKDLRLIWKDFPLPMHARAEEMAAFARAIQEQGGDAAFWAAHDRLFERQSDMDDASYRKIADDLSGIRWEAVASALKSKRHARLVLDGVNLGERLDVQKTPTTFVNGRKAVGLIAAPVMEQLIAEEMEKARSLVGQGVPPALVYDRSIQGGKQIKPLSDLPAN